MKTHKYKKNMEADYPLAPFFRDRIILENFTYITATTAKCRRCKKSIAHTFLEDFTKHLQTSHDYDRIIELENRILQKGPMWKYIKLRRDSSESYERYECVLCRGEIANLDEEFLHHTHAHDEDDYTIKGKNYEEWQIKYCKKRITTSIIKCDLCEMNVMIKFDIHLLMDHIKDCKDLKRAENRQKRRIKKVWGNNRRFAMDFVQCKVCKEQNEHLFYMFKFKDHLKTDHEYLITDVSPYTKSFTNVQKLHPDDLSYRCTMCKQKKLSGTALLNHECREKNNVDYYDNYLMRFSVRISDFLLKCAVCPKVFFILEEEETFCEEICENLDRSEEMCDNLEHDCEGICVLKKNLQITYTDKVWQYFDHESNTRAICKLCKDKTSFKYVYIDRTAFLAHVEDNHFDTFKLETEKQSTPSWKYIKYVAGISACVLCHEVVHCDEFDRHMHDINDFPLYMLQDYEHWLWKYSTIFYKSNDLSVHVDLSVCCDICRETIQIPYDLSDMRKHLKEIHSDILQQDVGIEGIPDPSSLAGTQQQRKGLKNATRSSVIAQQQDVDMSGTSAKRRKNR